MIMPSLTGEPLAVDCAAELSAEPVPPPDVLLQAAEREMTTTPTNPARHTARAREVIASPLMKEVEGQSVGTHLAGCQAGARLVRPCFRATRSCRNSTGTPSGSLA